MAWKIKYHKLSIDLRDLTPVFTQNLANAMCLSQFIIQKSKLAANPRKQGPVYCI